MLRKIAFEHAGQLFAFLCATLTLLAPCAAFADVSAKGKKSMVLVIDPGHGGPSLGARGSFSLEKDVVLKVAKKLGALVEEVYPDVTLHFTRTTDTLISLEDRGALANRLGADLFISIHANGNPSKLPTGTETYVMGLDKTDKNMDVAMNENAEIRYEDGYETKYEGYDPSSPESFILFSFMQNAHMEQSLTFAAQVEKEFSRRVQPSSRGVRQGPFLVLWKTTMPSVLVEIGFITNADDERYITSERGQTEIAESILAALGKHKSSWEKGRLAAHPATTTGEADAPEPPKARHDKPAAPAYKPAPKPAYNPPPKPTDKVTYHVQIFSTSRPLKENAREFKGLKGVDHYRYMQAYRYYVGSAKSERELKTLLATTRKKFPDAFIVRLRNGKSDN
ncbi:MAG: N-acetylmuramoyl-L-alanine amidase [Prevotellaceae bacterium]|jgi:N-acetylmuramoyl-L-alanine amidase|nr:N-acetylmuramoyl-L-alanine amidase [Prevotellaceae bacterium]